MRGIRRAVVAVIAAGSVVFLGFGVAHAVNIDDVAAPAIKVIGGDTAEGCSHRVTVKENRVEKKTQESEGDGFTCTQSVHLD